MLKVGIIGCGKIAQLRHIPEYRDNGRVELVAFCDQTKWRATELAHRYGGTAYGSYTELLKNQQIEAVSVCVANHLHAEVSLAALAAGKHVLCEKPMATTMVDCVDMVLAAEKAQRKLLIGHNQLLTPAHRRAHGLLAEGLIGKMLSFRTTFGHGGPETWSISPGPQTWFFNPEAAGFGAIADLGIHKIYLIQYLTGQRIVEVLAKLATLHKRDASGELVGVDDNAWCIYTLENGISGVMTASWTYYGPEDNSTVLYGTKGIMRIYDDPRYAIVIDLHEGGRILHELESIQTNTKQAQSGVIDAFVSSILDDAETELSGKKALDTMRAIFATVEAARSQRAVSIRR